MSNILDFEWYAPRLLKIQTKNDGVKPFKLRQIQKKFIQHLKDDFPDGIIRSISLKPRQAGWSTLISGINTHGICTKFHYKGLVMADKFARTSAVHSIYTRYIELLDPKIKPMIAKLNDDEVLLDNPNRTLRNSTPGLGSGFLTETAQDKNAGKSSSRRWAHLSEYAFYPFATEIDQSVQNSIPLAKGTAIFKESTANGMGGDGESFFEQWTAAERGDYLYKPFFVAWYEVDDYQIDPGPYFILTDYERDLILRCPEITNANLAWRRMKIAETMVDRDSGLSPEELFKQDFPSYPEEAFLASGRPVFDMEKLKRLSLFLRDNPPSRENAPIKSTFLSMYRQLFVVFNLPEKGRKYSIGADVAEGLEVGDSSHGKVFRDDGLEVAYFHGKLDPDHFGRVLVEMAKAYNNAYIVPEMNNMGHTTLNAIKDSGYLNVYEREVRDEIDSSKVTKKLGWKTTTQSKQTMLNTLIAKYRDNEASIRDIDTVREMLRVVRGDNGNVDLNGKDRVVATCLGLVGLENMGSSAIVIDPYKKEKLFYERKDISREHIKKKGAL